MAAIQSDPSIVAPLYVCTTLLSQQLTEYDFRRSVEPGLDVCVDSLVLVAAGAKVYHLD